MRVANKTAAIDSGAIERYFNAHGVKFASRKSYQEVSSITSIRKAWGSGIRLTQNTPH
jgi:hypothetical protein